MHKIHNWEYKLSKKSNDKSVKIKQSRAKVQHKLHKNLNFKKNPDSETVKTQNKS